MLENLILFVNMCAMRCLWKYGLILALWAAPAAANMTVAVITPKAGAWAEQGAELTAGAKKAAEEINASGGLLKQKIKILDIDDQCNDSIAVSTAQMLALMKNKKIALVIGPYCANSFEAVAKTYAGAKIFQIIPTAVDYAQAKTVQKGLIKMLGYTSQQAVDFFKYYNTHFAGEKVAIVSNLQNAQSTETAQAVYDQFAKHGKTVVVQNYTYDMTQNDYEKLAKRIIKAGNKVVFLTGSAKQIRKTAGYLKERKADLAIFINKYQATDAYFEKLEELAEGTYVLELSGKNNDPEFAEALVKLRLSGFETDGLALYGYSALKLWEALVKKAGSFDYAKVSAKANNGKIETDLGNHMFHNGAPKNNESYAVYLYQNGHFNKVY
jgi:branched-chain amino acid transport system substrate-binding protein